jgi:hypothetical protein
MTYGKAVLIAVDQLVNSLLAGWPDETLSSRAWRWDNDGVRSWPKKVINAMFFWQKDHCLSSYNNERDGRQLPPELR